MKRLILLLAAALCVVTCKKLGHDYYITYDTVDVHSEPSDDAPVVAKLTCSPRPQNFKRKDDLIYVFNAYNNTICEPVEVTKKDKSGEWGLINELGEGYQYAKGWIKLSELLFCKNGWEYTKEEKEAYVAKTDKQKFYLHPSATSKEMTNYWVNKGDTVMVLAKADGWVHVMNYNYRPVDNYNNPQLFGWMPVSKLQPIDAFSIDGAKAQLKAKEKDSSETAAKIEGYKSILAGVRWLLLGAAALALLWRFLFIIPARKRCKENTLRKGMTYSIIFLGVGGALLTVVPLWLGFLIYMIAMPLIAYVALYPLLYLRFIIKAWPYAFWIISLYALFSGGGMYFLYADSGPHMNILLLVVGIIMAIIIFFEIETIFHSVKDDICPVCGYWADHIRGREIKDREERESYDLHWKEEKRYSDGSTKTDSGVDHVTTVTSYHHRDCQCCKCGTPYTKKWVNKYSTSKAF